MKLTFQKKPEMLLLQINPEVVSGLIFGSLSNISNQKHHCADWDGKYKRLNYSMFKIASI